MSVSPCRRSNSNNIIIYNYKGYLETWIPWLHHGITLPRHRQYIIIIIKLKWLFGYLIPQLHHGICQNIYEWSSLFDGKIFLKGQAYLMSKFFWTDKPIWWQNIFEWTSLFNCKIFMNGQAYLMAKYLWMDKPIWWQYILELTGLIDVKI